MRLCHLGDKFKESEPKPSGSYLWLAVNMHLDRGLWQCKCKCPMQEHKLDWYGRSTDQAEWRKRMTAKYIAIVCKLVRGNAAQSRTTIAILDRKTSPSPIQIYGMGPTRQQHSQQKRASDKKSISRISRKRDLSPRSGKQ